MIVDISRQVREDCALAVPSVRVYTATPLPLVIAGVPRRLGGLAVAAVQVVATNADGAALAAPFALSSDGDRAFGTFAPAHFARYGTIRRGFVVRCLDADGATLGEYKRDLEVLPGGADAEPGDPSRAYVEKGGDQYLKTQIVDGVQHYAKMELARDVRIHSFVARYTGDYILVDGTFVEVTE